MSSSDVFLKHQYLNLETFRKSGEGVRTPVWFAQEGSMLYVWTERSSGKAKRVRRSGQVNVAPCDQRGQLLGDFVSGQARLHEYGTPLYEQGNRLITRKYGWMKKVFEWTNRLRGNQPIIIQIQLSD